MILNKESNKLINEKSPYLLQHAHNPVNWYPWGEEAFKKAKEENKPIFLSIGYSTCHWCHVMEQESFEDEEVAKLLNDHYISIKVDREERPDIDNIYMTFCQATTGSGGWPLNVFITPNKEPFYAGTYFPKHSRYNIIGLIELLNGISDKWNNHYDEINHSVNSIMKLLKQVNQGDRGEVAYEKSIKKAYDYFVENYDVNYGGFGRAPKFPTPHNLFFLLRYYKVYDDKKALEMVEETLIKMYKGGIFDHIGYGFSRYATDQKWLVPHFEKMLYDNALLIMAYVEAYQVTKKGIYQEVADKIITYVLRDMVNESGGFFSAEDADSEGVEGKFYVWTPDEVLEVLGETDGQLFNQYYDISNKGNFEGKSIPNLIYQDSNRLDENPTLKKQLEDMTKKLFESREKRIHPHKDDKILSAWNGLMIRALAFAGRVFHNQNYIDASTKALSFIEMNLMDGAKIHARYRDGERKHLGYLDDYSFMTWAYLELYDATFNIEYLKKSYKLAQVMMDEFEDKDNHGYYMYSVKSERLILRPKEIYDGAMPSGQSVLALLLQKLSIITGDERLKASSDNIFKTFSKSVYQSPMSHTMLLCAMMFNEQPIREIVIAGDAKNQQLRDINSYINELFSPFTVKILNDGSERMDVLNSFAKEKSLDQLPTVYICENFACQKPVNTLSELKALLT